MWLALFFGSLHNGIGASWWLLSPKRRAEILALPLNHLDSQDTLTWTKNKAPKLLVKSAYRVALKQKFAGWVEHSSAWEHGMTWGRIWKLNVPPKVRTFIWRAYCNCLPTRNNLCRRKVRIEPICEFCRQEPDTTSHVLWSCHLHGMCGL